MNFLIFFNLQVYRFNKTNIKISFDFLWKHKIETTKMTWNSERDMEHDFVTYVHKLKEYWYDFDSWFDTIIWVSACKSKSMFDLRYGIDTCVLSVVFERAVTSQMLLLKKSPFYGFC